MTITTLTKSMNNVRFTKNSKRKKNITKKKKKKKKT